MSQTQIQAVLAGVAFGLWPLLYQRGGLHWTTGQLIMTAVTLAIVVPFAVAHGAVPVTKQWWFVVASGVIVTMGLISFNDMLQRSTEKQVGALFVLTIVVQIVTPAIYHMVQNGEFSSVKALGFTFAVAAAFCLL